MIKRFKALLVFFLIFYILRFFCVFLVFLVFCEAKSGYAEEVKNGRVQSPKFFSYCK